MLLVAVAALTANARPRILYPVDEGARDASFKAFRDRFIEAVKQRNTRFVLTVLHSEVHLSFGGHSGVKDFREMWKPDSPDTELWKELATILSLGGTFSTSEGRKTFWAPYTFSTFPDDLDAFEYAPIIGSNVRVRSGPSENADIISHLSYHIVRATFPAPDSSDSGTSRGWVRVNLLDGRNGYVAERYVRSPLDYRLGFERIGRKWLITAFVAGD
jgi:hypothetical protein